MSTVYHHGVDMTKLEDGVRPIQLVNGSVVGIVGTAPDADADAFPLNKPVLIAGSPQEATKLDTKGTGRGTLPLAMHGLFTQVAPIVVVVRVDEGADDAETLANAAGGLDSETGTYTGAQALLNAASVVGYTPSILIAPGLTHQLPLDGVGEGAQRLKNPVLAALESVADRVRGRAIGDAPNTNKEDAFAAADFYDERVYLVDPFSIVSFSGSNIQCPTSALAAGLIVKTDYEKGFWHSPSNKVLMNVLGTARPIPYFDFVPGSEADLLNEKKVATVIRDNGFRLWGNRTCAADPRYAFLNVCRTYDVLEMSIARGMKWAVDRNITRGFSESVIQSVEGVLRHLESLGGIAGGRCWVDKELNSPSVIAAGDVYFNFDFMPYTAAEKIHFRSNLNQDYYLNIFK